MVIFGPLAAEIVSLV